MSSTNKRKFNSNDDSTSNHKRKLNDYNNDNNNDYNNDNNNDNNHDNNNDNRSSSSNTNTRKTMSPQKIEMSLPYVVKAIAQPPIRLLSNAVDDIPVSIINSQFNMISNRLCIPTMNNDYPHYDQLKDKYNSSKLREALIDETKHILKELRSLLELRNEDIINRNRNVINTYLKAKRSIDTKPLSFVIEAPTMNNIMTVTANIPAIDQVVINSTMVNPENVTIAIHTKHAKNDIYNTRNDKRFEQIVTMPIDDDIITTDDINDNETNQTQNDNTNNDNNNDDKQECIVPKVLIPGVLPLPKSIANIITNRNFRTEDDPTMRFIPYFGETDTSGIEVGGELYKYVPGGNDFEVSGEAEELTIYHLLTKHGYELPDNDDEDEDEDYSKNAKKEVLTALSHVMKISEKNIIVSFKKVSQGKRDLELSSTNDDIKAARIQRLGSSVFLPLDGPAPPIFSNSEKYNNNAGIRNVDSYDHLIDNYKDYFCRRCYTYYCTLHGIQQPQPCEKKKAPAPPLCPVPYLKLPSDLIRRPHLSSKTSLDSSDNNGSNNSNSSSISNNNKANMSKNPDTVKNVSSIKGSNWVDDFAPGLLASSTDKSDGTSNKFPPYNINAVEDVNYLDKISFKLYGNANTSVKNLEEYEKALITKFHSILTGKTEKKVEMITKVLGTRIKQEVELYLEYLNQKPILCQPVAVKKKGSQEKKKSRSDKKVATKVLEYEPCRHDGPCDDECPCVNNDGNFGGIILLLLLSSL